MDNVIIPNPEKLEITKAAIAKDGIDKLHILSDFDRTLTKRYDTHGNKELALLTLLEKYKYFGDEYNTKSKELLEKYLPIESDPRIPLDQKKKEMDDWWRLQFDEMIRAGISKQILEHVVKIHDINFRKGTLELFDLLNNCNIPIVIMSATGLGGDTIRMYLNKAGRLYTNIYVIGNSFEWDKSGRAIHVKPPIVHTASKDEAILNQFPFYDQIKSRMNVILLGDVVEDVHMVKGFDYTNIIKIGFYNRKTEEYLEQYKKVFDVIITNDGSMEYVNELLKELTTQ